MNFFLDRCTPIRVARMVNIFDDQHSIVHHDDDGRFGPKTTDVEWLTALAQDNDPWIIVSGDGRILKNKVERHALTLTGMSFFSLSKQWPHMPLAEYAWRLIKIWPEIVKRSDITQQRIFEVYGGGSMKIERKF